MLRHTDGGGIFHHGLEETRRGILGKNQARVEISQRNKVTESHIKCW